MCVQLNRKAEFDRIWKWAKPICHDDDTLSGAILPGPAGLTEPASQKGLLPMGRVFYHGAVLASHRWGDGEGIHNYSKEACTTCATASTKGNSRVQAIPCGIPGQS